MDDAAVNDLLRDVSTDTLERVARVAAARGEAVADVVQRLLAAYVDDAGTSPTGASETPE